MLRLQLIPLLLLFNFSKAQTLHKDQMDHGFKGNVKVVVKTVSTNPTIEGDDFKPDNDRLVSTYTYYFNSNGNIDSAKTEYTYPSAKNNSYKTIYQFENLRRSEWVAVNQSGERLLTGKIKWVSDKEYVETVSDISGNPKFETTSILNDSFRIVRAKIKAFDASGNIIQDDTQEFTLDKQQNIESYKTTHNTNGQTDETEYKYLKTTDFRNAKEILMIKREKGTKTLIRFDYTYF